MSRALNIFEEAHVVNGLPPINATGGKSSDIVNMEGFRGINFTWQIGVSAAAPTKILVYACDDAAGTNPVAIAFKIYKSETALGDIWGAATDVTAAGYTPSANDNIMYGIFVDAQALASSGKGWIYSQLTNGTNSVIASCHILMTGPRFAGANIGLTAIV